MRTGMKLTVFVLAACMLMSCSDTSGNHQSDTELNSAFQQLAAGDNEEAIKAFTLAIAHGVNSYEAYVGRGDAYAYSGDSYMAAADYSMAILKNGNDPAVYLKRAVANCINGADAEIQGDLDKALELSNGSVPTEISNTIAEYINKIGAENTAKPVIECIGYETAVTTPTDIPAESVIPEQPPHIEPVQETGSPAATGTLADITNLDELLGYIVDLELPLYPTYLKGEVSNQKDLIELNSFGFVESFCKMTEFKSPDEYRSFYAQYMDDSVLNLICHFNQKFAFYENEFYYALPQIGFGGLQIDQAELDRIEDDGDYIVKIPKVYSVGSTEPIECYEFAFRKRNGTFYVAECLDTPYKLYTEPAIGYALVNVDRLNCRSKPSTSGEKQGQFNRGALVDVYEIVKDGEYTWYRCNYKNSETGIVDWIADNGSWLTYKAY